MHPLRQSPKIRPMILEQYVSADKCFLAVVAYSFRLGNTLILCIKQFYPVTINDPTRLGGSTSFANIGTVPARRSNIFSFSITDERIKEIGRICDTLKIRFLVIDCYQISSSLIRGRSRYIYCLFNSRPYPLFSSIMGIFCRACLVADVFNEDITIFN